ncbi:MAG: VanZ family protein [Clostridia bacterium]|nr:VanZ family protein [Clostridia bacterium]
MVKKIILTVLLVAELFAIFYFSSQDSERSSETSGSVCMIIAKTFTPGFEDMTDEEQALTVERYQLFVRKCAHMTEFALLTATAFFFFINVFGFRPAVSAASGVGFCALCAFFDELHQNFVPGRAMKIADMLIDICGGILGLLAAVFIRRLVLGRRAKKSEGKQVSED